MMYTIGYLLIGIWAAGNSYALWQKMFPIISNKQEGFDGGTSLLIGLFWPMAAPLQYLIFIRNFGEYDEFLEYTRPTFWKALSDWELPFSELNLFNEEEFVVQSTKELKDD